MTENEGATWQRAAGKSMTRHPSSSYSYSYSYSSSSSNAANFEDE